MMTFSLRRIRTSIGPSASSSISLDVLPFHQAIERTAAIDDGSGQGDTVGRTADVDDFGKVGDEFCRVD